MTNSVQDDKNHFPKGVLITVLLLSTAMALLTSDFSSKRENTVYYTLSEQAQASIYPGNHITETDDFWISGDVSASYNQHKSDPEVLIKVEDLEYHDVAGKRKAPELHVYIPKERLISEWTEDARMHCQKRVKFISTLKETRYTVLPAAHDGETDIADDFQHKINRRDSDHCVYLVVGEAVMQYIKNKKREQANIFSWAPPVE